MADIQLLVTDDANRRALASVVSDRHNPITELDFQPADLYLVDDASLPRYQEALEAHKREQAPIFCPVVLIRRSRTPFTVNLPTIETRERPLLVNEILSAPVEQQVLFRRIGNLLARRHQTSTLREKNERLERFASTVRHELRNPLNVLNGWFDIARNEGDPDAFETCQSAIDQMTRVLKTTVLLLEERESEIERESVDLAAMCEHCWAMVPESNASLEITTTQHITADKDRLKQLLGNLFRNSVEHGGDEVTVTVGDLDDGFFVEDDGPGIPESERDAVFEEGYSSVLSGSGLGLAVVRKISEIHDWKIALTDSNVGGVRFEVTGVETSGEEHWPDSTPVSASD